MLDAEPVKFERVVLAEDDEPAELDRGVLAEDEEPTEFDRWVLAEDVMDGCIGCSWGGYVDDEGDVCVEGSGVTCELGAPCTFLCS
jgi:hypothetical protein